ncbi:MAG: hypothetical protein K2X91_04155 [Thermoleophilia bacterium]|nr:hypothetical protein [Thermoleophilia bacterium]
MLEEVEHPREEIIAALEAIRRAGGGAVRMRGYEDPAEMWAPEACMGIPNREGLHMPTTLIRQMVAGGYANVTTAYASFEEEARRWVKVPVRVYWTRKGIERR